MSDQGVLLLRKQLKGERPSVRIPLLRWRLLTSTLRDVASPGAEAPATVHTRASARLSLLYPTTADFLPADPAVFSSPRSYFAELTRNPIEGFSAGLVDDSNVFEWQITIMGPPDTL